MRSAFVFKKRHFQLVGLFASAIVLAIALAHVLNSRELLQPSSVSSSPVTVESPSAASSPTDSLAVQTLYNRSFAHYGTVSRGDGSFRRMFVEADTLANVEPGQPLPDDTLILMETWNTPEAPGTIFIKQKQNGVWQYGSFSPNQPDYRVSDRSSCHSCHAPFPETDFTLTKPLLEAALRSQQVQTAYCDRPGRTPCAPEAYFPSES